MIVTCVMEYVNHQRMFLNINFQSVYWHFTCIIKCYCELFQQASSFSGGESARPLSGGLLGHPVDDPRLVGIGSLDPILAGKSRNMGFGGMKQEIPLPPDASNTLFVEGLPANCTRREVSRIHLLTYFLSHLSFFILLRCLPLHALFRPIFCYCSFTWVCRYLSSFCRF